MNNPLNHATEDDVILTMMTTIVIIAAVSFLVQSRGISSQNYFLLDSAPFNGIFPLHNAMQMISPVITMISSKKISVFVFYSLVEYVANIVDMLTILQFGKSQKIHCSPH